MFCDIYQHFSNHVFLFYSQQHIAWIEEVHQHWQNLDPEEH